MLCCDAHKIQNNTGDCLMLVRVFMFMAVDANERRRGVCQANARVSQSLPSKLQAPLRGFLGGI